MAAPAAAALRKKKSRRFKRSPVRSKVNTGTDGPAIATRDIICVSVFHAWKTGARWCVTILICTMPASSQDRNYARSMVISRQGIAATSQTLASQAGAQVLARGGSAADAAIAANAVLGVVEPMSDGMGGDLFALYWEAKTGKLSGLNSSGWAPQALTVDFLKAKSLHTMPQDGIQSVTVPGCVEGWSQLHKKFGRLPWADIFRPAIYYARNGFPVTEIIHEHWKDSQATLNLDENGRRVFLRDGGAPAVGDIFQNPDLAKALGLVAN